MELNLRGAMLATHLVLRPMRLGEGGVVVNIASTAGLGFGLYVSPEYAAAKPAPRPPEEVAGAVVEFVRDEDLSGRVMWPSEPARLLDPELRL